MTDDLLEQLRARNPAPAPLPPPPIDDLLARIAAGEQPSTSRWPAWLMPSLAIAVAAAVAAFAIVSIGARHHAAISAAQPNGHTATSTHTRPLVLRSLAGEAMRGSLHTSVVTFGSGGTGVIAWTQYRNPGTVHPAAWLATTGDGGRSWNVQPRSFSLSSSPVFDGSRNGWTSAVDASGALRFYATHDGGRSWAPTQSAAATEGTRGAVSIADGTVWAVGTGSCAGSRCKWVVMRGPASGDRLPATASQPLPLTSQNATTISAASATTAYVSAPARLGGEIYVTDDGGRDWRRMPAQCGDGRTTLGATVTGADALWRVCSRGNSSSVLRTTNGGGTWSSARLPFVLAYWFEPVSAQVAWAADVHGTIYRTANGGASWQPVWRAGGPHGRSTPGFSPVLSAQGGDDASVLVQLTDGPISRNQVPHATNLIVYRTTDAGRSWQPTVVKLPPG